jgi:hypothetical protein
MEFNVPLLFLTYEEFPLLSRTREVIVSARNLTASFERLCIPDGTLIVDELTNLGIKFLDDNRLTEAEDLLLHAIKIQECIDHRMHYGLLRPLITLGALFAHQRRFEMAEPVLLRALMIVGKTGKREEHRLTLINLIHVYHELNRPEDQARMHESLLRLFEENPFVVRDRYVDRKE